MYGEYSFDDRYKLFGSFVELTEQLVGLRPVKTSKFPPYTSKYEGILGSRVTMCTVHRAELPISCVTTTLQPHVQHMVRILSLSLESLVAHNG